MDEEKHGGSTRRKVRIKRTQRIRVDVGERQSSLGRSAVVESPDTFRSRPESKKPFQLHLRTNLADSNWYVVAHTIARYTRTRVHDTRWMAFYVYARRRLSLLLLSPHRSFSLSVSRSAKRVREAASYMIHSLYKNNRLL